MQVQLTWHGPGGHDVVETTTTDATGAYHFTSLPPGGYTVQVIGGTVPPGLTLDASPAGSNGATSNLTLNPGQTDNTRNFGYTGTSALSGSVYVDQNNNGVINGGEPPIPGTPITLAGTDIFGNSYTATTATLADGTYSFGHLVPGTYKITETQPAAYADGISSIGTVNGTPDGNTAPNVFSGINLSAGQSGISYNFGELPASITGMAFLDGNRDGQIQPGETGLGGITITLRNGAGMMLATTMTAPDGTYSFSNLPAGMYTVTQTTPAGYGTSPTGTTYGVNPRPVTLTAGATSGNQDFGDTLSTIAGGVYLDSNANGVRDPGEPAIPGVTVTLSGNTPKGAMSETATTDAKGNFSYINLLTGTYSIQETQPAGYGQGSNAVGTVAGNTDGTLGPAVDQIGGINLPAGTDGIAYVYGETTPPGTFVTGTVYTDLNRDGQPGGPGEVGIGTVTITLVNSANKVVGTTTTNPDGTYSFSGIAPGTYTIQQSVPGGYGTSTPPTISATVPSGGLTNQNFGDTVASLTGVVYVDQANTGALAAGDTRLAGVTVTLTGTDAANNTITRTAVTDSTGTYTFGDLLAGNYKVVDTQPTAYNPGALTVGGAGGVPQPPNTIASIPLGAGVDTVGYNYGELGPTVSGVVFNDRDRSGMQNGTEPGIGNVSVQLINSGGTVVATTTTSGTGAYQFTNIAAGPYTIHEVQPAGYGDTTSGPYQTNNRAVNVPLAGLAAQNFGDTLGTLAGNVYVDSGNAGHIVAGDPPISGTVVTLSGTDASGNTVSRTATTAADGTYSFTDLPTSSLAGYMLQEAQPTGFNQGTNSVGTINGTAIGTTGPATDELSGIVLGAGQQGISYNYGELAPGAIGTQLVSGTVYLDRNRDAALNAGDTGLAGITVQLLTPGGQAVPGFPPVVTGPNGSYSFANVPAGSYVITETPPAGFGSSEAPSHAIPITVVAAPVINQNFGATPNTLAGFVYSDVNGNKTFDSAGPDTAISGVTLTLTGVDATGASINQTAITAPDGSYQFTDLRSPQAGTAYTITESIPANYTAEVANVGTINGMSTGTAPTPTAIGTITLGTPVQGVDGINYNFGDSIIPTPPTSVTGTVFVDANNSGNPAGQTPISGVTVQLLTPGGAVVATTTTGPTGAYTFANVTPGTYTIRETQPAGYGDSPNTPSTTYSNVVVPSAGVSGENFGETLGSLTGEVYLDTNKNGNLDAGEPGIATVTVNLTGTSAAGSPVNLTTTTDSNGNYSFTSLPGGTYSVAETEPAGYIHGLDAPGTAGGANSSNAAITGVNLGAGQNTTGYLFGEQPPATTSVTGTIFNDRNRDGLPTGGEPGLGGVTVQLSGPGGFVATTTTNPDGSYAFTGLTPGGYTIQQTLPAGYANTPVGPYSQSTRPLFVTPAGLTNQNFGDVLGTVSGTVFLDNNNNGTFESAQGEAPLGGVTLTLTGNTAAGAVSLTTTTDSNGNYSFGDLPAGTYTITETQPPAFGSGINTAGPAGGTVAASPGNTISNFTLAAGQADPGNTFAELPPNTPPGTTFLSGNVFLDGNQNGILNPGEGWTPAQPQVTLQLLTAAGTPTGLTTTTNPDGSYSFAGIPPGNYIVREVVPTGYGTSTPVSLPVTVPPTGTTGQNFGETLGSLTGLVYSDLNNDGKRQPNEPGIAGVTVTLYVAGGDAPVASTTTDSAGNYQFTNLPGGNYTVVKTPPAGYTPGQNSIGSAGGTLVPLDTLTNVPLGAGVNASAYDFAEIGTSVSGFVYYDQNQDSTFQVNGPDSPLPGVLLTIRDGAGNVINTTRTAQDGSYSFVGLGTGTYTVVQQTPTGYGESQNPTGSVTVTTSLANPAAAAQNFGDTLGSLSGVVYRDYNLDGIYDTGAANPDTGIAGVTVQLFENGSVVATTTTDANGAYSFTGLAFGTYTIAETQPPLPTSLTNGYFDGADNLGSLGGSHPAKNALGVVVSVGQNSSISQNGTDYGLRRTAAGRSLRLRVCRLQQ